MFNDRYGLTNAVLEGRKTVTRRNLTLTLHKEINGNFAKVFLLKFFWKMTNGNLFMME